MAKGGGGGMGDLVKYGLLAVGGYILWNSGLIQQLGIPGFGGPSVTPAPTGGGGQASGLPLGQSGNTPLPSGGGAPVATPTNLTADQINALVLKASGGDVVAAAQLTGLGLRYNGWQWNYYRERQLDQVGKPQGDFPDMPTPITASDYLAKRAAAGLGGISLGGIRLC